MKIDSLKLLSTSYELIHDRIIPFMLKMEENELRKRIIASVNPVGWMVWHVLRVEDMFLSTVVFSCTQLFHKDNWQEKLNIHTAQVGTGMSKSEADSLAASINLVELAAYNEAVREHSLRLLKSVPDLKNDQLDPASAIEERLKEAMAFPDAVAEERALAYEPTPVSTCLLGVIHHTYMHFGQYLALTKPL